MMPRLVKYRVADAKRFKFARNILCGAWIGQYVVVGHTCVSFRWRSPSKGELDRWRLANPRPKSSGAAAEGGRRVDFDTQPETDVRGGQSVPDDWTPKVGDEVTHVKWPSNCVWIVDGVDESGATLSWTGEGDNYGIYGQWAPFVRLRPVRVVPGEEPK